MAEAGTLGDRIEKLRKSLHYNTLDEMAEAMRDFIGTGTTASRISEWKAGKGSAESLAALAMLHPDPRACLAWLREGGDSPVYM